ncbi:MAG TPA: succinate dehydrogenase, cytochrome b556 subunit [Steroidobacteraceae bacterium]|nr:succinate dehydrogenase, cytochrome b556 subunit [Steroidobacteraceae bacterium]
MPQRPLSPHVFIYRFAYTMATSILHRATGLLLSAGLLLLVTWLVALAGGPRQFAALQALLASWPGRVLLGLVLLAFCYHFANGIRHLLWDAGVGLERRAARFSAKLVVICAVLVAAVLLYLFSGHGSAA